MTTVLFWDIDGTLLSTARAGVHALEAAASAALGRPIDLQGVRTSGMTDAQIAEMVLGDHGAQVDDDAVASFLARYERELPDALPRRAGRVLSGVREILDDLAGDPGFVSILLTGNTPAGAEAKLRHYEIDHHFDGGAFCLGRGPRSLIAQEALAEARRRLGGAVDRERAFVIGDSPRDVEAAEAIGVRCIAVATGTHSDAELRAAGAWRVLEELPEPARFRELVGAGGAA